MYDVVILVEEELSVTDAERLVELYADAPDRVKFHVVIPCEDAKAKVEASLTGLAGSDLFGIATQRYAVRSDDEVHAAADDAQHAVDAQAAAPLDRSVGRLRSFDREADGLITHKHPIDELVDHIDRVNGQEVVVLTRPHVIAELLRVDWSAQARRHLGVPVLHLLEQHQTASSNPNRDAARRRKSAWQSASSAVERKATARYGTPSHGRLPRPPSDDLQDPRSRDGRRSASAQRTSSQPRLPWSAVVACRLLHPVPRPQLQRQTRGIVRPSDSSRDDNDCPVDAVRLRLSGWPWFSSSRGPQPPVREDGDMELHGMTAALADAEDATRRARHSADSPNVETFDSGRHAAHQLAELRAREDLIVEELRRRSASTRDSVPVGRSPSPDTQPILA